jgi:hypothetical protein
MNITAKHIQRSNIIVIFPQGTILLPEASQIFGLYTGEQAKGSTFSDTPSMATRIFDFPVIGLQWVFEPTKIRLEDKLSRSPKDAKLAHEMRRVLAALYPEQIPSAYGFNYDMIYRIDTVIPIKEIMGSFLKPSSTEDVKEFGWQYTLVKDKGKRAETYFFKMASPIEYGVHANFHFNESVMPKSEDLQASFERKYADADESLAHITV